MSERRIHVFPEGNSFVNYNHNVDRLAIGNTIGLIKMINIADPDRDAISIDILENITSLCQHGHSVAAATTSGVLELVDVRSPANRTTVFRSPLPLRGAVFVNDGTRLACGGDDTKLTIVDLSAENRATDISLPDQLVGVSYNHASELLAVSLSNGDVLVYSVTNEVPRLVESLAKIGVPKINTSMDEVDFNDEHKEELISSTLAWTIKGDYLLVPSISNSIRLYARANWLEPAGEFPLSNQKIVDYVLNNSLLIVLFANGEIVVYDCQKQKELKRYSLTLDGYFPVDIHVHGHDVFVGTSKGEIIILDDFEPQVAASTAMSFLLDEAEESDNEEENEEDEDEDSEDILRHEEDIKSRKVMLHNEDSMLLDGEDDDDINHVGAKRTLLDLEEEEGADDIRADDGLDDLEDAEELDALFGDNTYSRKKARFANGHGSNGSVRQSSTSITTYNEKEVAPFSPGGTPWHGDRRYLSMNAVGYAWITKYAELTSKSVTISLFDRAVHKDYHLTDTDEYDLCSLNRLGILLGVSGYASKHQVNNGKVYFRFHRDNFDAWEKHIPLHSGEYITNISLTQQQPDEDERRVNEEAKIIVGTSFGYVRIYNLYGLCLSIMKLSPVVATMSSSKGIVFIINQLGNNMYGASIINLESNINFIQQNSILPLKQSPNNATIPLIKGMFFNENGDPCIVAGIDETLLVMTGWREPGNARWVPLLNCHEAITEGGSNPNKKNWKCWPLGLYEENLLCLILKNNSQYPGFPLSLPIEITIQIPVNIKERKEKKRGAGDDFSDNENDENDKTNNSEQPDLEESYLRALTMGKLANDNYNEEAEAEGEETEKLLEAIQNYAIQFDGSLLKLFAGAVQREELKRAFSIARMIKSEKALTSALKICERMDQAKLGFRIGELRNALFEED